MAHPLTTFVVEASRSLDLARTEAPVADSQLVAFVTNEPHLEFLRDLIGRARILQHCRDSLSAPFSIPWMTADFRTPEDE
jgi:hypothetical protein